MPFANAVEWELTRACDLSCRHCLARPNGARTRELSGEEALATAEELADLGARIVALSGGEPLLRQDWAGVASVLAERGVHVQMISNGQEIDDRTAARLREAGVGIVQLSLDGLEATHDAIRRRPGGYERVLRAARSLHDAGVGVGFITTVLRPNLGELVELAQVVREHRAASWKVWLGMPHHAEELWLHPGQIGGLMRRLRGLQPAVPELARGDNLAHRTRCGAGQEVLGIRSDGSVTGCLALPATENVGSLRELPLEHLYARAADSRAARVRALTGACAACQHAAQCCAGCHATALYATGNVDNPYCELHATPRRRPGRRAGLLAAALLGACGGDGLAGSEPATPTVAVPEPTEPEPRESTETAADADASDVEDAAVPERHPDAKRAPKPTEPPEDWGEPCGMSHMLDPNCGMPPRPGKP